MSLSEITMEGTLKPDGTLELDAKPSLVPGRVTVVLRQETEAPPPQEGWWQFMERVGNRFIRGKISPPPQENWWQFMQRARRELEASGAKFMNEEEVNAHIEWLREGDPIDDLLREADEQSRQAGGP